MEQKYRKFNFIKDKLKINHIVNIDSNTDLNKDPDLKDLYKNIIKTNIANGVESLTFKEFEGLKYTFGVELETASGRFDDPEVEHLNLKAVHDGSLRGPNGEDPIGKLK